MADSLIDFGKIAQTMEGFERNRIYEQNSLQQAQQNRIHAEHVQQQGLSKAYDELSKFEESPTYAGLQADRQIDLTIAKGNILQSIVGKELPLPSKAELLGGRDAINTMMNTMKTGTPEQVREVTTRAAFENPKWARLLFDDLKKAGELDTHFQEVDAKLKLNEAQLERLNIQNGRYKLQQNLFTEHASALGRVTALATEPRFSKDFQAVLGMEHPESRQAYLALHPAFAKEFDSALAPEKQMMGFVDPNAAMVTGQATTPGMIDGLMQHVEARSLAVRDAQAKDPNGQAPIEMADELAGYGAVQKARQSEAAWLQDPYNKTTWKALKKSEQDLRILQSSTGKKLSDVADQRNVLAQTKFDQQTQSKLAEADLQDAYIQGLNNGQDDNQALGSAITEVKKRYPGVPFDATKIVNPAKKGKLTLDINDPTTATRTHMQSQLTGVQSTLNIIHNLKETVSQNNIGLAAALKSTAYGFTSQIQGLAEVVGTEAVQANHKNFTPGKWFDPKLSTVDLLANTLAYRIINQEQGGRVSDKDFAEMKKRLNITSWMAGKEDVVQRLTTMEQQLKFEEGIYRRIMPTFAKPGGTSGTISTAADYLQSIGFGTESP